MTDLYEKVKDLMTPEQFKNEIKLKISQFNALIDEEAASYLILDELQRNDVKHDKISKIEIGQRVNLQARVKEISPIRTFTRKSGSNGEVVNIDITDGSGIVRLVLWDKDTEMIKSGRITKNSVIKIINGLVKMGKYEIEIDISKGSTLIIK